MDMPGVSQWVDMFCCLFLQEAAGSLSSSIAKGKLLKEQACYRPLSQDGQPVIGPLSSTKGVYIATGETQEYACDPLEIPFHGMR